tara:strand:- start:719 stop:1546 length:828 start_codon:yes stop_codon:yes gene_type:complete
MANISKINGVTKANIGKLNGITFAANTKVMGLTNVAGGTATTFLTKVSDWANASNSYGLGAIPTGWQTLTTDTVYGSTTADRQWTSDSGGTTPSSTTGPTDGHDSSASDGRESTGSDYIYTEATQQFNKRMLLRTPALNFTNALSNSTLQLEFWFHMYGSNMGDLGVAVTDNATSAGDSTLSLHFTGDSTGGATIVYWDDDSDDGSSTSSAVRISGQQQTLGHGSTNSGAHWRKATVDLNSVAGQSSVYIWFFGKTGAQFRSDICIDDVVVTGEE